MLQNYIFGKYSFRFEMYRQWKITRAVIIYRVYRFIVKLSCKGCTGNNAMLIETALSKYNLSCNNVDFIKSSIFFISYISTLMYTWKRLFKKMFLKH